MRDDRPTDPPPGVHGDVERAAADWLARRDGGAWDAADATSLADWLAQDPAHRVAFLRLQAAWEEARRLQALGAGWQGGSAPPRGFWRATPDPGAAPPGPDVSRLVFAAKSAPRRTRAPALALAATLCIALAAGWGWREFGAVDASTHVSAFGTVRTVPLADGSQTTLASDSRIAVRLSRRQRRVTLDHGEAFFEAAKDPSRPFVVEAGSRRVVAVGTRFSVRRDGPDLRVVVTEGTVRLESSPGTDGPLPTALLPAGSVALARRDGVLVRTLPLAEAAQLVDWRSGLLVFRDVPLSEAASEFNRYSARKIVIADADVGALRIGGSFRWENAEGFVRLLEQGFPVRAEYDADRIVLHSP